ncbi:hypothetical protein P8452_41575 [Trifolium repens]|nr:hypothetical protein QL285_025704 [Trifolium repens]WJX55854.1 hypothetical protein P8452_41575 [Trifolium repens]
MVEGLVERNHDAEAGSSTARRSRRVSTQVEEQDDEDGDEVSGQFLNDNSNSEEEGDGVPDQPMCKTHDQFSRFFGRRQSVVHNYNN